MDPIMVSLLITAIKEGVTGVIRLIEVFRSKGDMTDAEAQALLDRIKAEAAESDAAWDDAVAQARARLGGGA